MAVTYSSSALIKKAAKWIPSGLIDPTDFDNYIYQAESLIDESMGKTARGVGADFTFDAKQHGIVQRAATAIGAFYAITYNVSAHPLLEQTEMTQNLLYYDQLRALTLLADTRVSDFLADFSSAITTITYTSVALVKKAAKYISSALLDADLEVFIYQAEGLVDSVMRKTARGDAADFTFDSGKHAILQRATTAVAAFYAITYDVGTHPMLEYGEMTENLLYYDQLRALTLLSDIRVVDHLSGL